MLKKFPFPREDRCRVALLSLSLSLSRSNRALSGTTTTNMKNQEWRGDGERMISYDSDPALLLPVILLLIACLALKLVVLLLHGSADPVTSHTQVAPRRKNRDPRISRRLNAQARRPLHFFSLLFFFFFFFFARLSIAEHQRSDC